MTFPRIIAIAAAAAALSTGLSACSSTGAEDGTIRLATSPGPYSELFQDGIEPILEDYGYEIDYVELTDLQQANNALIEGSADANVEQHSSYMRNFNNETGSNLAAISPVPTVPAGLYSSNHDSLDNPEGATVGIPQDASNQARGFLMLEELGWVTLDPEADKGLLTINDVTDNPYNLTIRPMDSATIPRALNDLDFGVLPGYISYAADVDPELSLFQETLRPELLLQLVVREEDQDAPWAQDIIRAYKDPAFHEFLEEENVNNYWYVPEEIQP